jgi:hypothetical protein
MEKTIVFLQKKSEKKFIILQIGFFEVEFILFNVMNMLILSESTFYLFPKIALPIRTIVEPS